MHRRGLTSNKHQNLGTRKNLPILQDGQLVLDLSHHNSDTRSTRTHSTTTCYDVQITTGWQEHVDLEHCDEAHFEVDVSQEHQYVHIVTSLESESDDHSDKPIKLHVVCPERFNVDIRACSNSILNLHMENKLEGDVSVSCSQGKVKLDKIRGVNITANCGNASIESRSLIEGATVVLTGKQLKTKKLNGEAVHVSMERGVDIGSIYCQGGMANVMNTGIGNVNIDLFNGILQLRNSDGNVRVANLDGWFDVETRSGHVDLQINQLTRRNVVLDDDDDDVDSGHSSLGCRAMTSDGNLAVAVDPNIRASILALSTNAASRGKVTIVSDTFKTLTAKTVSRLSTFGVFTGMVPITNSEDFSRTSSRSGKVNLGAAEMVASLTAASSSNNDHMDTGVGTNDSTRLSTDAADESYPDLHIQAHGHVRVETLSWIELIRRKHGFGSDSTKGPPAKAGRAASSKDVAKTLRR